MIEIRDLAHAAELHATAKKLEKDAAVYKEIARAYILDHLGEDGWKPDPQGEKTIQYAAPAGVICVTKPTSKAVPAHFDSGQVERFRGIVSDIFPDLIDAAFRAVTTYTFDEGAWLGAARMFPERAKTMHAAIDPFIVPEQGEKPLSPRVEVK